MDNLSATDSSRLMYDIGVKPNPRLIHEYMNPLRDMPGLFHWLATMNQKEHKIMLVGRNLPAIKHRITHPWLPDSEYEQSLRIWVAVVPVRVTAEDYSRISEGFLGVDK
ncbi:hypothetical protein B0J13DRAFT_629314 [Dactylonectria estremocensis]|uniref:Uncharacterized protein n=1 Tax=Dactylonectria estremocensis TaxID=1079267 RepID=A0A9P9II10_9HYPO|nr:hypothetical protein B0J13DRAFT_629314 [Dactylonectria estremocensis]